MFCDFYPLCNCLWRLDTEVRVNRVWSTLDGITRQSTQFGSFHDYSRRLFQQSRLLCEQRINCGSIRGRIEHRFPFQNYILVTRGDFLTKMIFSLLKTKRNCFLRAVVFHKYSYLLYCADFWINRRKICARIAFFSKQISVF